MKSTTLFRFIIAGLILPAFSGSFLKSQTPLKIMPMGNSITYDSLSVDTRDIGDKVSYRLRLYQLLNTEGYTYNFIGSESSGGNYLPAGYADHAGFPGITAAELLKLLQTGVNEHEGGKCELPSCPQNYLAYFDPDIILLHIGTNGLTDSASAPGIVADIADILDFIDTYESSSGKTIPVFLARIINRAGSSSSGNHRPTTYFNQLLAAMLATRGADVVRTVNMETAAGIDYRYSPPGDMADYLHPAPAGYTLMGNLWYSALESYNYAAPDVSDISDQTVEEGTPFSTINLNNHVFDPQEADASITWTYSTPTNLNISISSGKIATITVKDPEWNGSETITFTAYDSGNGGIPLFDSDNATFRVTADNDPPALSGIETTTIAYTEGDGEENVTSTITVSDVDNTNLTGAVVRISSGFTPGEDFLRYTAPPGMSDVYYSSTGRLEFSGTATLATYRTALRSVAYENTNPDDPSTALRIVSFTVFDGIDSSNVVARNITVTGVNDIPVLSSLEGTPVSYTEGQPPVNITSAIAVIDVDDENLESATIRFVSGFINSEDRLIFTDKNNITGTFSTTTGILSLTGTSSVANYQAAIRSITYRNINNDDPAITTRTISFMVNDGSGNSNIPQRTLNVTAVNDEPLLNGIETSTINYTEGDGEVNVTSTITVSDVDNTNLASAVVRISSGFTGGEDFLRFTTAGNILGFYNSSTGRLVLTGSDTPTTYRTVLRSVAYENTNLENPSTALRIVSFRISDGADSSNVVSRNISINSTNNPPALSNLETSAISYTEGQSPVNITNNIVVKDVDSKDLVSATIRITGFVINEDQLNFSTQYGITGFFNPATGVLSLNNPSSVANYQTALRSITYQNLNTDKPATTARSISFTVHDGADPSNTVTRSLTVKAVNDPPVLAPVSADPIPYTEGQSPVSFATSVTVTDVDNDSLVSAAIRIDQNAVAGEDTLIYPVKLWNITGSYNPGTFTLNLSGGDTKAHYQSAIWSILYANRDTLDPETALRRISIDVNDSKDPAAAKAYRYITIIPVNDPPVARNVTVLGMKTIFASNTIEYDYEDPENDAEDIDATVYTWKRWTEPTGDSAVITGITTKNYILQYSDGGKKIKATVQPADAKGAKSGIAYHSQWNYVNAAPVATNVRIGGTIAIGQTDTVRFDYGDKENNPPNTGAHRYFWYRADDESGNNKTQVGSAIVYLLSGSDNNKYISCAVAPVAMSGSLIGDTVQSTWYGPISYLPSATISGNDTLCAGEKAQVKIALTGTSPWLVTYTINNLNPTVIPKIVSSDTTLLTDKPGTYRLTKVSDAKYKNGIVSGQAYVGLHDTVKVVFSAIGDTAICNDGVSAATLSANFTGTSPWSFVLSINNADTIYTNVTQDPFIFSGSRPGSYYIKSVTDKHCTSLNGSQRSITVLYKPSPTATIAGVDTICPGDTASLNVTLAGTAPWSITYTVNDANPKTVTGITTKTYTLKVLGEGIYKITVLQDAICTGKATGQGTVVFRSVPVATLSGGGTVCEGTSASLRVDLAGTSPWNFSYKKGTAVIDTLENVQATPNLFTVKDAGAYTLGFVHDKYCRGTVTGNVSVSIIPAPDVELSGLNQTYSIYSAPVPVFGSPDGGVFSGQGLIPKNDTMFFLPSWAGVEGSPHKISYTYQDPVSGCFGKDTFMVNVLEVEADIIFPDGKVFYCFNDLPFTVTGANIVGDTGSFSISGGIGLVDNGDNTARISPSQLNGDVYQLTYTYIKNDIPLSRIEEFTVEYVDPISFLAFEEDVFCSNDPSVKLIGSNTEGVFYGNAVTGNLATGFYFVPGLAKTGTDTIFYSYTTPNGCSRKVYEVVTINEAPQINFTVLDTCVAVGSDDSTVFINQTTSTDAITGWLWNFDDINSGIENESTLENPRHLYTSSGRKYVSLTASTVKNCESSRDIRFYFGDKPQADFSWSTECFNDGSPVVFNDQSSLNEGEISTYKWKFHTGEQSDSSDVRNPEYTFENYGDYKVELKVQTNYGCVDTFSKMFHLRPNIVLSDNNPYIEDFETGMNGWVSHQSATSEANSWKFGQPAEGFIGAVGLNAWYTKIDSSSVEDSWISSPCFDFTGITKPMIKMDIWRIFDQRRDGAVLQYRTNNEDEWHNIGDIDDGISWYNDYSIQGKPGGQSIGWSYMVDNKWTEAKHHLNDLAGLTDVQFRIAYGSNGTGTTNEGLAVDNIGICKRDKIVLLEHFTSSSDTVSKNANELVRAAITELNGDVVDIQYHTGYAGDDPMYLHNPVIVDERVFYYGLLDVPYTYLDGGYTGSYRYDYKLNSLETNDINLQSLADPMFRIDLNTEIADNSINISATLIAERAIAPGELTLHTVIIEREITGIEGSNGEKLFRNVVKAMLPNAGGTYIFKGWNAGSTEMTNHSWNFSNVFDVDELRVVVYVQDEATREIYQAAVDKFDFVSAAGDEYATYQEFKCMAYPNPASGHVYLRFNQPLTSGMKMDLFDNMGRLLESKMIEPYTEEYLIDTYQYIKGVYFVRISNNTGINEIIKILVIK
ncbi:MAG: T9SS type A sorting domain-containing protein [Bacteroidales bacterium]|nr:T9SS type A sorting domain-containing protein [Bacteroidales bacterium]